MNQGNRGVSSALDPSTGFFFLNKVLAIETHLGRERVNKWGQERLDNDFISKADQCVNEAISDHSTSILCTSAALPLIPLN